MGMGGSGISGDVIAAAFNDELPIPITVLKQYRLPAFVGPQTLAFAAAVTERIGLVATVTTTYNEPYNLAWKFASLDRGRDRSGGFALRGKWIGKRILGEPRRHIGAAAGKPNGYQRQHRNVRHAGRTKQLDDMEHGSSPYATNYYFE